MRHLNSLFEMTPSDVEEIFGIACSLKERLKRGERPQVLSGYVMAQLFEKPSLRTRLSFDAAMMQLGGASIFLNAKDAGLGGREAVQDVARVIGGYSDVITLRTFSQSLIDTFIEHSGVAIINGLSDERHPCQALTDIFTMKEVLGDLKGKKFVFVGDGNNVANSLAIAAGICGISLTICAPEEYRLKPKFLKELTKRYPHAEIEQTDNFKSALKDASIIYTDVWTSMGQEAESEKRQTIFGPYQVNETLLTLAPKDCRFMHCLPAKRGMEVTDGVIDGPQSIVFQQAQNRMHLAKGLLLWVLELSI